MKLTGQGHKAAEEEPLHGDTEKQKLIFAITPLYTSVHFDWKKVPAWSLVGRTEVWFGQLAQSKQAPSEPC